jgi:hypothetical protein
MLGFFLKAFVAGTDGEGVSSSICRIAKESAATTESFVSKYPALVTGFFFFAWYVWLAPKLLMTCVLVLVNYNPYKGHQY